MRKDFTTGNPNKDLPQRLYNRFFQPSQGLHEEFLILSSGKVNSPEGLSKYDINNT